MADLHEAIRYAETIIDTDPIKAHRILCNVLEEEPDNALALFCVGHILVNREELGLAYNVFKRVVQLAPHREQGWNNLGLCIDSFERHKEARECFEQALKRKPNDPDYLGNLALTWLEEQDYKRAIEFSAKSLAINPKHPGAGAVNGYAHLALGNWVEGWRGYECALGGKYRKEYSYGDEKRWDGSPGKVVAIYGEQGLGDEIMAASMLPDAIRDCSTVIVDCDPKLEGLLRRSFPGACVFGTRREQSVAWLEDHVVEARAAALSLGQFYRRQDADFPAGPYLVADPDRRVQWRALFDSWGPRPKIGLCWTGGIKSTGAKRRQMGLEALRLLIESFDADFVSLQYKDPTAEIAKSGLPVRHFKWACETPDYDDTAALVAELDVVIGVSTTVHHLADALGVPSIVFVPLRPTWLYARDPVPFHQSWKLFRQKDGEDWSKTVRRFMKSDLTRMVGYGAHDVQHAENRDRELGASVEH